MDGEQSTESFKARVSLVSEVLTEQGEAREVLVNEAENALHWMFRRKHISEEQYLAGERLRQDYTHGQLAQRVTADWERQIDRLSQGRAGYGFLTDKALAAKLRFLKTIEAMGPEFSGILVEVCCLAAGIEQAERRLALPVRSGKTILSLALTRLARHYGLIKPEAPSERQSATRHWALPDYKPDIA